MIRIGICDDIYDARMQIRVLLERILERKGIQGSFIEFSSGEKILQWLKTHIGELDVLFLDMKMTGMDGMETAKRIRRADEEMSLVFVTSYADRVFEGYSVSALAYLMKPARRGQLEEIINRVVSKLYQNEKETFFCTYGDVTYRIPYHKILYFVSDRRTITCVTKERKYTFYNKLDHVAMQVGKSFVRIHQRYLVRAAAVDSIVSNQVHIGEEKLPISRSMKDSAIKALTYAALEEL